MKRVKHLLNHATSLGGRAPAILTRYIRYAITSILPAGTNYAFLLLFVELFKINYLISAAAAFIFASCVGYFTHRSWGFSGTIIGHNTALPIFLTINILGGAAVLGILAFEVEILSWGYFISNFIALAIMGLVSFLLNYYITFELHKLETKSS